MRGRDEVAGWVALRAAAGIGDVIGRRLVARFGDPRAALAATRTELAEAGFGAEIARGLAAGDLGTAAAEVARTEKAGGRVVPFTAPEYPALLRAVADAPLYLVARGEPVPSGPAIAVVGSRRATLYGRDVARRLAEDLAQAGVVVVSGLALGVDGAAHAGALAGGGQTVAVLGSGIDVVYPAEHRDLAEAIVGSGTLLSERPVGTPPLPAHFPARNRIIAGMTHGTVVVEAGERSGALITARLALEYDREVFAVPGRIDSPLAIGPHRLIQEGAKLAGCLDDVLAEIAPALHARASEAGAGLGGGAATGADGPLAGAQAGAGAAADVGQAALQSSAPGTGAARGAGWAQLDESFLALMAGGPVALDRLVRETGLPPAEVLGKVLDLELRGVVQQLPGGQLQIARR
jgi:DNA processing protein